MSDGPANRERLGGGRVDIHQRSFAFAVRILKLVQALPQNSAGWAVARQLARSGTSIGANIEEAQGASSRAEFARRINIARAEARETVYWVRLIVGAELLPYRRVAAIQQEAEEIAKILTAIVKNTKRSSSSGAGSSKGA